MKRQEEFYHYLPTEKSHIVPIMGLSPELLKESAKKTITDREEIKHSTVLNIISKSLGFTKGFAGFKEEYESKLHPFMQKNGLETQTKLLVRNEFSKFTSINPRSLADRLFQSNLPLPVKVFYGNNFDFSKCCPEKFYNFIPYCNNVFTSKPDTAFIDSIFNDFIMRNQDLTTLFTQLNFINDGLNYLGDQLIKYPNQHDLNIVLQLYHTDTHDKGYLYQKELSEKQLMCLRSIIEPLNECWLTAIPYNDNLIFLKDTNGNYDFLFKGLRSAPFIHNPIKTYTKNQFLPKNDDTYHFKRWLYFRYNGWFDSDSHKAENAHYEKKQQYSNFDNILKRYLTKNGLYTPPKRSSKILAGFKEVKVQENVLCVSDLITIKEFSKFVKEGNEYFELRTHNRSDKLETVNSDGDNLPASVTWFDANAYARWFEDKNDVPVRLLSNDEYIHIAPDVSDNIESTFKIPGTKYYTWHYSDGSRLECNHPPYMEEKDFQSLYLKYKTDAMEWRKNPAGVNFLISSRFGEWLQDDCLSREAPAISTYDHGALLSPGARADRCKFSASSTGKYKSLKIGFRLCYQLSDSNNNQGGTK